MSELNRLQKAALWSGIISCFIGFLAFLIAAFTYMGINPFIKNETNPEVTVIQSEDNKTDIEKTTKLSENIKTNKDSAIQINNVDNTLQDNRIINLKTKEEMTLWEILIIPFKKHEKANYFNTVIKEKSSLCWWILIVLSFCAICWFISPIGYFCHVINNGYDKKDPAKPFITVFLISLCWGYYILTLLGLF